MTDAIAQLCQIIIEKLREQPEATQTDLIAQVEVAIAENPQLSAALQANPEMLQNNREGATGFQTVIENGAIANLGDHYHLSDPERFQAALTAVLEKLRIIRQSDAIPQNLPHSGMEPEKFVGREDELHWLHDRLQQNNRAVISAIAGMGGVGKTELAIQYALTYQQRYPGGVCWLSARAIKPDSDRTDVSASNPVNINSTYTNTIADQILRFTASHLDLCPPETVSSLPNKVHWCWQHWQMGNVLLIFDDVVDYANIKPYLPSDSRFRILITSRFQLLKDSERLELKVLRPEEALSLLELLAGAERVRAEASVASKICQWLGYLPLGLELVGRYLARKPDLSLTEMFDRLQAKRLNQSALQKPKIESDMTAEHGVAAAFELSWHELSATAQELGCLLSIFDIVPLPWNLIEQCTINTDSEELENARDDELLNFHLLQREDKGIYKLHELIREFFQSKLSELFQVESLQQAITLKIATIAKQDPLLITEILSQYLLDWTWSHDTQPSSLAVGQHLWIAIQAWAEGIGTLTDIILPHKEDGSLPTIGIGFQQKDIRRSSESLTYIQIGWNFSDCISQPVIDLPSKSECLWDANDSEYPWNDDANEGDGWSDAQFAAWLELSDAGWQTIMRVPFEDQASWPWQWSVQQTIGKLSQRLKDRSLPVEAGHLSLEAAWHAAQCLIGSSNLRFPPDPTFTPIPLETLEARLATIQDSHSTLMMRHCLKQLRIEVEHSRRKGESFLRLPTAIQAFKTNSIIDPATLNDYASCVYHSALIEYEKLANKWFSKFLPRFQLLEFLPVQIVGWVVPLEHQTDAVNLTCYWKPLPKGSQSCVDFRLSDRPPSDNDPRRQSALTQQRSLRLPPKMYSIGESRSYSSLKQSRLGEYPVTELVYQWLWQDLKQIEWAKGELPDAGYPYWR